MTELNEALQAFYEMRIKVKKPMTDYAKKLLSRKLEKLSKGNDELAIEILEQSIICSWTDIYPLKKEEKLNKVEVLLTTMQNVKRFPAN